MKIMTMAEALEYMKTNEGFVTTIKGWMWEYRYWDGRYQTRARCMYSKDNTAWTRYLEWTDEPHPGSDGEWFIPSNQFKEIQHIFPIVDILGRKFIEIGEGFEDPLFVNLKTEVFPE